MADIQYDPIETALNATPQVQKHLRPILQKMVPVPQRGDECRDKFGVIRCMAVEEGFVMARRPGCVPFVVPIEEWHSMTRKAKEKADHTKRGV